MKKNRSPMFVLWQKLLLFFRSAHRHFASAVEKLSVLSAADVQ